VAPGLNIHASCVVLARAGEPFGAPHDLGVLILGESGTGKSDLALRLIANGAILVADDRCDLFVSAGALYARVPPALQGMIEVRGVGIVNLPHRACARIGLAVRLVLSGTISRLPEPARYRPPETLAVPETRWPAEIAVVAFEASAPAKIAAAAATFAA
jgi:serine kinase of HPr protein (carbohydrate metabolism regulator)